MNSRSFPKILVLMVCLASVSLADFSNYLDDLIDCRRVERQTQNPVAARPCGFEPLRRHSFTALGVGRSAFTVERLHLGQHKLRAAEIIF